MKFSYRLKLQLPLQFAIAAQSRFKSTGQKNINKKKKTLEHWRDVLG